MMSPQNRSLGSRLGNAVCLTLSRDQRERLADVPPAQVIFPDARRFRGDFRSSETLGAALRSAAPRWALLFLAAVAILSAQESPPKPPLGLPPVPWPADNPYS